MGKYIFGSQYLRGMTPPPEFWGADMAAMKAMGFNTIRAWIVWGVLEPEPGNIDYPYLQRFLDLAQQHELQVIALFHLHGAPEWVVQQNRECWYVDETGRAFEPTSRPNTPSGGWPGLCPDHARAQQLEADFIVGICREFGTHPALYGWEPINEPHMWVDFSRKPSGVFCYCPETRACFVKWLRNKYGELSQLEQAWGRKLPDWDQARPPTWCSGLTDWVDWRLFTAASIAGHVARRTEVIRTHSAKPVLAHSWGGGACACPDLGGMTFDDWRNARQVDTWGCSAFPDKLTDTPLVGLAMDASRSACAGGEYWQSELGAGDYGSVLQRRGRVPAQWLAQWSWESIRHGARGLLYWQYRKETQGHESGAYGLCDYAGEPTENSREVARIGEILFRHGELFSAVRPTSAEVGIVFSLRSYLLNWVQTRNCELAIDALSGYYRIFWDANIPVDILHEDFLPADLSLYKLLILPLPVTLSAGTEKRLREFVEGGGTLFSDPYLCAYDPNVHLDGQVPGRGLAALMGCQEKDIFQAENVVGIRTAEGTEYLVCGSAMHTCWTVLPGGEVLAVYDNGEPAIVGTRQPGGGRAIISGLNISLSYSPKSTLGDLVTRQDIGGRIENRGAAELLLSLAKQGGIDSPVYADDWMRVSLMEDGVGRGVLIVLSQNKKSAQGTVRFHSRGYTRWEDLYSGSQAPLNEGGINLNFAPYGVAVIRLTTE